MGSPSKEPGNFGDPLSLGQYDTEMRARELNNGRFAMFAALGIIAAELLTGKDAIEQFGLWVVRASIGHGVSCRHVTRAALFSSELPEQGVDRWAYGDDQRVWHLCRGDDDWQGRHRTLEFVEFGSFFDGLHFQGVVTSSFSALSDQRLPSLLSCAIISHRMMCQATLLYR